MKPSNISIYSLSGLGPKALRDVGSSDVDVSRQADGERDKMRPPESHPGAGLSPEVSSQEGQKEHDKFGLDFLSKGCHLGGAEEEVFPDCGPHS